MTEEKLENAIRIQELLKGLTAAKDKIEKAQVSEERIKEHPDEEIPCQIKLLVNNYEKFITKIPPLRTEAGKIFMDGLDKIIHDLQFAFNII